MLIDKMVIIVSIKKFKKLHIKIQLLFRQRRVCLQQGAWQNTG